MTSRMRTYITVIVGRRRSAGSRSAHFFTSLCSGRAKRLLEGIVPGGAMGIQHWTACSEAVLSVEMVGRTISRNDI